jgi:hypothetical protein
MSNDKIKKQIRQKKILIPINFSNSMNKIKEEKILCKVAILKIL